MDSKIKLSVEQTRRFLGLLDNPPKPNEALKQAMERFKKKREQESNDECNGR